MATKSSSHVHALRTASTVIAFFGIVIDISAIVVSRLRRWNGPLHVTIWAMIVLVLCMVSNHVALHWSRNYKEGFRPILIIIVDDLLFLDFLGLLVANGLVINHIGYRGNYHLGKVQLLTYNSMAWILCGMIHALLSIEGGVAIIKDKFPKRGSRCMDCNRNIGQRKDPGAADDAHHALLGDEEYRDEADTAGT